MTSEEVLCNFDIYGYKKNWYPGFMETLAGTSIDVGSYCTTNVTQNVKTVDGVAYHSLPNGYEFDDEQLTILKDHSLCFNSDSLGLYGDVFDECWVSGDCQYYSIGIKFKDSISRASCARVIDLNKITTNVVYYNVEMDASNYSSPWNFETITKYYNLMDDQRINLHFESHEQRLTTSSHQFGMGDLGMLADSDDLQTKVNLNHKETTFSKGNAMEDINMYINFFPGLKHFQSTRDYVSFVDALSYFGGLYDFIIIFVGFLYGNYLTERLKKDMVHKACMITGKFGLKEGSTEY